MPCAPNGGSLSPALFEICSGENIQSSDILIDLAFNVICPDIEIITPVRDKKLSREYEIEYLRNEGIEFDFSKAEYSINQGLWEPFLIRISLISFYSHFPPFLSIYLYTFLILITYNLNMN